MTESSTHYGRLIVGKTDELFARVVAIAAAEHAKRPGQTFTWALSGGGTPREWYRWAVENRALSAALVSDTHFTVSDERMVPLSDDASNFGVADRLLLSPLEVPAAHRHPWRVDLPPLQAAEAYRTAWLPLAGQGRAYHVCMLGMGEDAHTASFFPGTSVFEDDGGLPFIAVDTSAKGWRLTITPTGLRACEAIIVVALGKDKARALKQVMRSEEPWGKVPAKILSTTSDRVTWLVDPDAASLL